MYGWRARIGLMISSVNTVMAPDFYAMAPTGVSTHTGRLRRGRGMEPSMKDDYGMADQLGRAAEDLASGMVDALVYGCTGGSLLDGVGYDEKLSADVERAVGIPTITTSTAV